MKFRSARSVERPAVLVFLAAQVAILAVRHFTYFSELFRYPTRLASGHLGGAGSSLPLLLGVLGVAALWAGRPWSWDRFATAGLANLAASGLTVYVAALATGRLFAWLPWAVLAISTALAAVTVHPASSAHAASSPRAPLSPFDALSALFLSTLLIPSVFPYVAFDAKLIWAWRAYAMRDDGFAVAVTRVLRPEYPPLDSILLWLGIGDPLFEGRLIMWLLLVLFALFFRARLARIAPRLAPAGLLFLLATVHVWQGIATFYADVPLMVFVVAGSLLVLGLPTGSGAGPSRLDRAAGALCLAAAVLVRPDGAATLAVVGLAVLWRARPAGRTAWLPAVAALAAWGSWVLRPASLRPAADGFRFFANSGGWREAGEAPGAAIAETAGTYLNALQGQWLAHYGLGAAVWLIIFVAAQRALARKTAGANPWEDETRLYGAASFLSLAAVALIYAVLPFTTDVRAAVAPDVYPTWLLAFRNFARVGMGRMAVHMFPFWILYAVCAGAAAALELGERYRSPRDSMSMLVSNRSSASA